MSVTLMPTCQNFRTSLTSFPCRQRAAKELSGLGTRQPIDHLDVAWPRVRSDGARHQFPQGRFEGVVQLRLVELHERLDVLADVGVRDAHDRRVVDGRM